MAEQTLILGAENHLVATLTPASPTRPEPPRYVAVLTNSGVIPRCGPHRMNVHLARKFAEMGIASIRFDMSGLGDSRRASSTLPVMQQWVADTRSVMDTAQAQFGCDRFLMVGFCSGAEVAYRVALEDPRLRAAVLWDQYAYPTLQSRFRTALYRLRRAGPRKAIQLAAARALLALRELGRADIHGKDLATEDSSLPPIEEFTRCIQTLVDDRVELMFAYSGGEPEVFNYRGQFRAKFGHCRFINEVAFNYLELCDHLITRRAAQQSFTQMVVRWLEQRVLVTQPRKGTSPSNQLV